MRKSVFVLTILTAAASSGAVAAEVNQETKPVLAGPVQMSDAEMDNITAGFLVQLPSGKIINLPDHARQAFLRHHDFGSVHGPHCVKVGCF